MPYSITRGKGCSPSKPWGVVKDSDGTVVACHATKESALAQIRALYKVEPALAKARERVAKHPGHADQKSHGGKGSPTSLSPDRQKKMTGHWGHSRTGSTSIATASRDMMGIPSRIDVAGRNLSEADYKQAQIALDNISSRPAMVTVPLTHTTSRMPELEKAQTGDVVQLGLTATTKQESKISEGYTESHIKEMQVLVFTGTKPTHLYSGRRSAPEEAIVAGEFRVVGKKTVDVPRTTFRNGVYEPWTSKATVVELEQVSTFDTATKAFVPFSQPVAKHLPHQHNQQTHGSGGTSAPESAPKKRNKKDIAGDDQRASELYASGKTWDEVATEMGYANGGVARRAGKRHEERAKDKPADDTPAKPKTEDVTPPTPVVTPPVTPTPLPVDIVNPRPMTGEDPSQQTIPTDDINLARETGRPYKPFTEEGHSPEVRKATDDLRQMQRDAEDHYEQHFGEESRRRSAIHREKSAEYAKAEKEWEAQNPRAKDEDYYPYWNKREKALAERGLVKPKDNSGVDDIIKDGLVDKVHGEKQSALHKRAGDQWDVVRKTVEIDTAEHLLGAKATQKPRMETDWDGPRDADGRRPMKQATESDYDGVFVQGVGYPQKPAFDLVYVLPNGKEIANADIFSRTWEDLPPEMLVIRETASQRVRKISQINTRQRAIDGDGDGKFNEAMKSQLATQQAIVDSPNTRIVIHAPVSAVGGIATSGRFKSQHETGRSKGFKGKEAREAFEAASIGTVAGADKSKTPIYGAVHVGGVQDANAFGLSQYGEVGFVLRRDTHQRATFTDGDSLSLCYEASPMTGTQTRFNGHSVNGGVDAAAGWSRRGTPEEFSESLQRKPKPISSPYREAQVLGGVSLADVEYVTVPSGTKFPEASRRKLAKAGIPIVEYDRASFTPLKGVDADGEPEFTSSKEGGIWTPLPEPTGKRLGVVVDIFKHLVGERKTEAEKKPELTPEFNRLVPTVISKHLAGKHDQRTHGGGGGIGAPRDTAHAKQKQAWELHEQGKTWEEVAKEAGYANGGAARLAGKAHEKRMKAKGDGADIPKPAVVVTPTPKPKTQENGSQAIKDAQAVVDKATGGRPVADVLAEERRKGGSEPTAKELEVTEAVIQSGAILRGEVKRRQEALGKDAVDLAKRDLEVLTKDSESYKKDVDKAKKERQETKTAIAEEVIKSPEMDERINTRIDRIKNGYVDGIMDSFENDRATVIADIKETTLRYETQPSMTFAERDTWIKGRAKERYPSDKRAQKDYAELLSSSQFEVPTVTRIVAERDPRVRKLKADDENREQKLNEAHANFNKINREMASRNQIIADNGVTPTQNHEIIRAVLTDAGRTMGDKPSQTFFGTKPVVAELREELKNIPDQLWDYNRFGSGLNVKATAGRAHFSAGRRELTTSGSKGSAGRASTLLHEATHAVEHMNPSVTSLEFVMLSRRAKGRAPQKLQVIERGSRYRKDEIAIEDEWSHPYSGKIYGSRSRTSNYEIMSMGMESLYKRGYYPDRIADEDHLNFVMGVLAHA